MSLNFSDGSKWEDISKVIVREPTSLYVTHPPRQICVPVIRNVLIESGDRGTILLRCICTYVELDPLASFTVHTDETILFGRELADLFFELIHVSHSIISYT